MYQIITLCTLNLHSVICQLYLNKKIKKGRMANISLWFIDLVIVWEYGINRQKDVSIETMQVVHGTS